MQLPPGCLYGSMILVLPTQAFPPKPPVKCLCRDGHQASRRLKYRLLPDPSAAPTDTTQFGTRPHEGPFRLSVANSWIRAGRRRFGIRRSAHLVHSLNRRGDGGRHQVWQVTTRRSPTPTIATQAHDPSLDAACLSAGRPVWAVENARTNGWIVTCSWAPMGFTGQPLHPTWLGRGQLPDMKLLKQHWRPQTHCHLQAGVSSPVGIWAWTGG